MSIFRRSAAGVALKDRWTDIFRRDVVVHLALMASMTAATFQSYIKDRVPGYGPYVLADVCFLLAILAWAAAIAIRHAPLRGPGSALGIILAVTLLPPFYLMLPGTPLLIQMAGLRGWSSFPLAALIALSVVRNGAQVRAYFGLILVLCILTASYGIWQYQAGPNVLASVGDLALSRHGASTAYYLESTSQVEFRAFSTFTYPSPFAGMMVFGMLIAAGMVSSAHYRKATRMLCAVLIVLFFMGMTVSGTRAALVTLAFGLIILAWYRGVDIRQILVVPIVLLGLHLGATLTAGRILERYQTLLSHEGHLWTYVYAPITVADRALSANLFGIGLGRSGVGVPYFLFRAAPRGFFIGSDGDIGRAAVELGLFGLAVLTLTIVGLLPPAARSVRRLLGTKDEDVALSAGPLVLATGSLLLIGSPLSTVPHGTIWWFMLGALLKLYLLHATDTSARA
jgi:hypothetical protein